MTITAPIFKPVQPLDLAIELPFEEPSDYALLQELRILATHSPTRAKREAWQWLRELQAPPQHYRLPWLFAQGSAPDAPEGDCEGIVMNLYGKPWLTGMDRLVRVCHHLNGMGWTGKSFNPAAGTGFNRITLSARIPMLVMVPGYRFRKINDELIGFHFRHEIEASPLWPFQQVRSIKYDDPKLNNPRPLPKTRDELVEIIPGVYIGRALYRDDTSWKVIGFFGLRHPLQAR